MPDLTRGLTDYDVKALILIAAKKLNKYDDIANDPDALNEAVGYFNQNAANKHSATELANIALLGVLNVYIAGTERPVVRYAWGNLTGVPDKSPYTGGSGGGSRLDQVNGLDYHFDDTLGVEARVIANYLRSGEFDANYITYLEDNGINVNEESPNIAPKLEPKPKS